MSSGTATGRRQVGRCGNCNGWVWSDQDYVEWEGIVPIHQGCWD